MNKVLENLIVTGCVTYIIWRLLVLGRRIYRRLMR